MKARIPLEALGRDGELYPTPVVWLRVRDRYGILTEVKFRVDTQADVTTIPITAANQAAIPFTRARPGTARGIAGRLRKYRHHLRVVIAGREHTWPCDFTESAIDPETKQPLGDLPSVLGRAGFLTEYAVAIDGDYLIIRRIGPIRRRFRKWLQKFWRVFGLVHPANRPL